LFVDDYRVDTLDDDGDLILFVGVYIAPIPVVYVSLCFRVIV